jgi:hypothetical protein
LADKEIDLTAISFPGIKALFKETDYYLFCEPGAVILKIWSFITENTDSLLERIQIQKYHDGQIRIWIKFNPQHTDTLSNYFKKCGIDVCGMDKDKGTYCSYTKNTWVLFQVITMHSGILKEQLAEITPLIKKG